MSINALTCGVYSLGNGNYNSVYSYELKVRINSIDTILNKSNINLIWIYKKISSDPWGAYNNTGNSHVNFNINSQTSTKYVTFDLRNSSNGSTHVWESNAVDIQHNNDGTKEISLNATHETGNSWGSKTLSNTLVLPTIARASNFNFTGSPMIMDGNNILTVNIQKNSSEFTHNIEFGCGVYKLAYENVTDVFQFKAPLEWNNAVTSSQIGTGTITLTTYKNDVQVGNKISKSFSLKVPENLVPSIGNFTATLIDNDVPINWNIFVQNKSGVSLCVSNAQGSYSSRIISYKISGNGIYSSENILEIPKLLNSGENTFEAIVTDSRGRTCRETISFIVFEYQNPTILDGSFVQRCDENGMVDDNGSYLKIYPNINFSSLMNCNSCTSEFRVKEDDVWGFYQSLDNNNHQVINGIYSSNKSFEIEIKVSDTFSTVTKKYYISTAFSLVDFHSGGKAIAFGKTSENDKICDFGIPIKTSGGIYMQEIDENSDLDDFDLSGYYYCENSNINSPVGEGFYMKIISSQANSFGERFIIHQEIFSKSGEKWERFKNFSSPWSYWRQC